ncbi:mRNA splicing protein [Microbotryomycetes sp. JL221]|nr:mRNA splicing protein [Microbotryomycetes sp. JL221]
MATLLSSLPAPRHSTVDDEDVDKPSAPSSSTAVTRGPVIPPYGQRKGWRPKTIQDYGDGGSYPECHVAQYPLEMGRKNKSSNGNTLALQVDADGNVRYDAIAQQGHRDGRVVQSAFKDLVPMAHRTDIKDQTMQRPTEEDVQATADRTKAALEKLVQGKIKAAQPKNVETTAGQTTYMRYTPNTGAGTSQRIIKMTEVVEDPLEPPKFKGKKVPRGPPSPPPPILRSPPRKVTAQEQKDWMIPPCVSNWKNNKGYTIPLDKRLAADGRGLQDVVINDRFAQFSEALYVADRHAREEVRQRSLMQQKIAQKEKEAKEDHLRMLAQRAREERSGIPASRAPARVEAGEVGSAAMPSALAGYGSDSDEDGESAVAAAADDATPRGADDSENDVAENSEDEAAARERDRLRRERNAENKRKMGMNNMGAERRAKELARQQGRDISEKIALGLAKPTMSKESMLDSRLFNREQLSGSFGDDDSYALYDRPLFSGSSAAAAIYKPRGANIDDEGNDVREGITKSMQNDRFGLGVAGRGFDGADTAEVRDGPVAFEKDTADPFAIDAFLASAKAGAKRGLDDRKDESARKRTKDDD